MKCMFHGVHDVGTWPIEVLVSTSVDNHSSSNFTSDAYRFNCRWFAQAGV